MSLRWHYSSSCASCSQGTSYQHRLCWEHSVPSGRKWAFVPSATLAIRAGRTENKHLALTGHTSTQTHRHMLSHFGSVHWKPTVSPCLDGCFWRSTSIQTKILCLEASPVQRGLRCTAVNFWQWPGQKLNGGKNLKHRKHMSKLAVPKLCLSLKTKGTISTNYRKILKRILKKGFLKYSLLHCTLNVYILRKLKMTVEEFPPF